MPPSVDLLSALATRHPDYTGPTGAAWWTLLRDAYEGEGGFRALVASALQSSGRGVSSYENNGLVPLANSYLIRYPRENDEAFARRQQVAAYENYVAPVVDTYGSFLWAKPSGRRTESEAVRAFWASADRDGSSWEDLLRDVVQRTQLFGWCAVLFDRDEGNGTTGQRPTLAAVLDPEELADWQLDADGEFAWARLVSVATVRDPFGGKPESRETHTIWTRETWQRFVVSVDADGRRTLLEPGDPVPHALGRVPVLVLRWADSLRRGALYGVSQVQGVAGANVDLFNVTSELREHLRASVFALLTYQTDQPEKLAKVKVGTSNALTYPKDANPPAYIAPPPDVAVTLEMRRQAIIAEIYRAAKLEQPKGDVAGGAADVRSGVARAYDFALTNRVLCGFALELEEFERDVVALVARWESESEAERAVASTVVQYPKEFDVASLSAELATQFEVLDAAFDKQTGTRVLPPVLEKKAAERVWRTLNPIATPEDAKAFAAENESIYRVSLAQVEAASKGPAKPTKELAEYMLPAVTVDDVRAMVGLEPFGGDAGSENAYAARVRLDAAAKAAPLVAENPANAPLPEGTAGFAMTLPSGG